MVLAAGLGTRLRPLTYEIPKPMVPVLDRPVMAHILDHLRAHGLTESIANLHYFPDTIKEYFGDELIYRYEPELLGTAGGVRNCADFLCEGDDDSFLIISGDALTDINLPKSIEHHRQNGGIATLAAKRVVDTSQYGVILAEPDGRINGFQEKPDPAEALSNLGNCGIYLFRREIFDYFPQNPFVDWAMDVFPTLLENDIPFYVHDIGEQYWNDVGSLDELRAGTFDAVSGALHLESAQALESEGGVHFASGEPTNSVEVVEPPVWVGENVRIGDGVRLHGPVVIGDGATIGDGAAIRDTIIFPGTDVPPNALLINGIIGHTGIVASLRPRRVGAKAIT